MPRLAISVSHIWLERYTAALIILGGFTFILAATLHPFNFAPVNDLRWQLVVDRLDLRLLRSDSWIDIPRNIILFVPFGLGISILLQTVGLSARGRVALIGIIGFGTTLMVEGLQFLLQLRSPEVSDLLANTWGVLGSYFVYQKWVASSLRRTLPRNSGMLAPAFLTLLSTVAFIVLLPFGLVSDTQRQSALSGWDSDYRLALGNELTGDRPWYGRVDEVIVLDRAAKPYEVASYLQSSRIPAEAPEGTVTHYCIACKEGLRDRLGLSPELVKLASNTGDEAFGSGKEEEHTWLETASPATDLSKRVATTSEFSVLIVIQPRGHEQTGPARILTLSKDTFNRNFTLGQEGDELVVRLRTLGTGHDGHRPEFRIPGIFGDDTTRRIAMTYTPSLLRVYVDSVDNVFSARLAPEIAIVTYLIPNSGWHVTMRASSLAVYSVIYCLLLAELALPIGIVAMALATGVLSIGRCPASHAVVNFRTLKSDGV